MNQQIQPDEEELQDRLNQPPVTLEEALTQFQATTPLTPLGEKLLQQSN